MTHPMPEDLANPMILCGWSALLDALSLINHKDRVCNSREGRRFTATLADRLHRARQRKEHDE